jgi:hypothetical protein
VTRDIETSVPQPRHNRHFSRDRDATTRLRAEPQEALFRMILEAVYEIGA